MGRFLNKWICLIFVFALHDVAIAGPAPDEGFDNYFVISEKNEPEVSLNPIAVLKVGFDAVSRTINLLMWDQIKRPLPQAPQKYDRLKHFGTWIRDPRDHDCLSTRAKVLIRESTTGVEFDSSKCAVRRGRWYDPSVDQTFEDAQIMEIDHFVPVKNAYISGAWKWSRTKRCLYFNFLGNSMHLIPFNRTENRRKADNTPDRYMPPESKYRCEYLYKWLVIKSIWKLALNPSEADAIEKSVKSEKCDLSQFTLPTIVLKAQRQWMTDNAKMCE